MNMLPSIRAYCLERIAQLEKLTPKPGAIIDELRRIVTLCDGLEKQFVFLDDFVKKAVGQ